MRNERMKLAGASDIRVVHKNWGDETRTLIVRASDDDRRGWVTNSPLVRQLSARNIANVGITWAGPNFKLRLGDPGGTFFMGCFDGSGVVHHKGDLDHIRQGMACILPPQSPNHFEITDSRQWTYAFVRYLEPPGIVPLTNSDKPNVDDYDAAPLVQAIWGLHAEASSTGLPSALHLWVELIHGYVMQFALPRNQDARVCHAWEQVTNHLSYPWTLKEIAAANSMSAEHFRRLCLQSTRRSPMKHLTHLRMQQAVELLTTTDHTIETIALEVGYAFASTFSNTFRKWSGRRPSEFRLSNRLS